MTNTPNWASEPTREVEEYEQKLSASATKRLKRCPEQFRLRYIEDKEPTKETNKWAKMGTAVHTALEVTIRDEPMTELVQKPHQLRETVTDKFRDIAQQKQLPDDMVTEGVSCCQTACRFICMQELDNVRGVEVDFEFALTRRDIDSAFHGYIDIAAQSEIWDWKTGRNVDEENEIIQGMLYAMGFYQKYNQLPERVRFVYVHEEMQVERTFEPTDENWRRALDHVKRVVEAKDAEKFPADPESSKCYFCSFSGWCSAYPAGAGDITYEEF